jgi:DNA-binding CsgD family transcriptional regulator
MRRSSIDEEPASRHPLETLGDVASALENLPLPTFALSSERRVVWQNRAAKELVGDLANAAPGAAFAPEWRHVADDVWARRVAGGFKAIEFEAVMLRPNGDRVPVEISSSAIESDGVLAGVFGVVVPTAAPAPADPAPHLTPRQAEVLRLLAQGASTQQMAVALGVTTQTVRNHVRDLLHHLGVHSRLAAVVVAQQRGLV